MVRVRAIAAGAIGAGVASILAVSALAQSFAPGPRPPTSGDGMASNALRGRLGVIDAAAAQRGEALFRPSCGFCHGADGRGAQGPPLIASLFVVGDPSGKPLHDFLKVGRPATGMPPFPDLTAEQAADMTAFLQQRATEGARRAEVRPEAILVGDATAGRRYFEGAGGCARCHSAAGDLKGIGSRYNPMIIQARMINPRTVGRGQGQPANPPTMTVKVTQPGGAVVSGRLVQVNDFFVTLVDGDGVRRTIERDNEVPKVEIDDPVEAHRQQMLRWTDENMWNVTAYLASLK